MTNGPGPTSVGDRFEAFIGQFLARTLRTTLSEGPLASGPVAMFGDVLDEQIGAQIARGGALADLAANFTRHSPNGEPPPVMSRDRGESRRTSGFGMRADPFTGRATQHQGVDLAAPMGSRIRAAAAGDVVFAGERGGYGQVVILDHGDGLQTRYAHCSRIDVAVGQRVGPGEDVALVGSTGRSTGPHLHFEVRRDGVAEDPTEFLRAHSSPLH